MRVERASESVVRDTLKDFTASISVSNTQRASEVNRQSMGGGDINS